MGVVGGLPSTLAGEPAPPRLAYAASDELSELNKRLGLDDRSCLDGASATCATEPVETRVPSIPSSSRNSAVLALAALTGIGVLGGARSIRKLSGSCAPDWYHTGGPQQIGYATAFDVSGEFVPPVPLPFDALAPAAYQSPIACSDAPPLTDAHSPGAARAPPFCADPYAPGT